MTNDKIKFSHIADLHLGSYREKTLTDLNIKAFKIAIKNIIEQECKFLIIAGDIFNTPMPNIEIVNMFAKEIKKLKKKNIPVYLIGGSHDYSNSKKSYLELLNTTELIIDINNVNNYDKDKYELILTENKDLKLNIGGIVGKKSGLEKMTYSNLKVPELKEDYLNIFVFHTTIDDMLPSKFNFKSDLTKSFLPIGFDYYAGGHIHTNVISTYNNKKISYSGCLFPNNFSELKEEESTYNVCEYNYKTQELKVEKQTIKTYEKEYIRIECENLNPIEARNKIIDEISKFEIKNKLILLEILGNIDGRVNEIGINNILKEMYDKGCHQILKNTYKLKSNILEQIIIDPEENIEIIEDRVIQEVLKESENYDQDYILTKRLLDSDLSKIDEEKNAEYEDRVIQIIDKEIDIKNLKIKKISN